MFDKTLQRIQEHVRDRRYVMTRHAKQEMEHDGFTIFDVERGILSGNIVERQRDLASRE